jgi:hypothetical protein
MISLNLTGLYSIKKQKFILKTPDLNFGSNIEKPD